MFKIVSPDRVKTRGTGEDVNPSSNAIFKLN